MRSLTPMTQFHITFARVMPCMDESCHVGVSYATYERVHPELRRRNTTQTQTQTQQ